MITDWVVIVSDTSNMHPFEVGPFRTKEEALYFSCDLDLHLPAEFGSSIAPILPAIPWRGRRRKK